MLCITNNVMGLFDFLKKNDSSKESFMSEEEKLLNDDENSSVLILDHPKVVKNKTVSKNVSDNLFIVTGVYAIGTQVMFSGKVQSGVLKKKLKTKINDKESILTELKTHSSLVKQLVAGDEGTIFLKGKNLFLVKIGDILKFN